MTRKSDPNDDLGASIEQHDRRDRQHLALLLDRYVGQRDRLLVQTTQMGNTEAFIGSVPLEWLDSRVRFASQLPLFRQKFDSQSENVVRDRDTIDEIVQRPLDWSRQLPLTLYLVARAAHKFPAVLVVLSPSWVDDPDAPQWDKRGRARQSAAQFLPLDKDRNLGVLDLDADTAIFALDGQHRLMGIQGLMTLLKTGRLQRYNKNKKAIGSPVTTDEIATQYHLKPGALQRLATEKIGIEFIPAVEKGETREQARRRVRSIFVHVNLMAVKLSKGQLAVLNEDDGFSIVARQIAVSHPLFKEVKNRNPRVNWDSATVASKSTVLTTLQALQDMAQRYLSPRFPHWYPSDKKGLIPLRPDDDELELARREFSNLFDLLGQLGSYQKLENGIETPELRRFSHEKSKGQGNLLFRPVGQVALAQALGIVIFEKRHNPLEIFEKLERFDREGGFSHIEFPRSLWYGILYDPNKRRILVSGRDLASRLLVYLLGGLEDNIDIANLRQDVAKVRTFEEKAISFEGKLVKPKEVGLPDPL